MWSRCNGCSRLFVAPSSRLQWRCTASTSCRLWMYTGWRLVWLHWGGHWCCRHTNQRWWRLLARRTDKPQTSLRLDGYQLYLLTRTRTNLSLIHHRGKDHQLVTQLHTYIHTFSGLFSRTTRVSRHQKDKPFWILLKQEWWVLVWLSVWSEVQIWIWPSRCHCDSLPLAPVNPDWFYLSGTSSPG